MLAMMGRKRRFVTGREIPSGGSTRVAFSSHRIQPGQETMSVVEAQCVYRGIVFHGTVEVSGSGSDETVHVRYDGDCIEVRTAGLDVAIVAPTLLRELVMQRTSIGKRVARG